MSAWFCFVYCPYMQAKEHADVSVADRVIVAYVTSWSAVRPDPSCVTHINYAFGHVNETFNGIRIDNPGRLKSIVELKETHPHLKVMLSVGGWGSGRFSEMVASDDFREQFAQDCNRVIREYQLDGIDVDWEYPTSAAANISASPEDKENFTFLMRDIRQAIGQDALLTLATVATAEYMDFPAFLPFVDFVNIMAYDMATPPFLHAPLYRSERAGKTTSAEAVEAHLLAGVPPSKLVLGMPFYGRGGKEVPTFLDYKKISSLEGMTEQWDEVAKVPYLTDSAGDLVLGYENARSLAIKCEYILEKGLRGGMYWDYDGDTPEGELRRTVCSILKPRGVCDNTQPAFRVLVLTERGGQHGSFTDAALEWLSRKEKELNFRFTEINRATPITEEFLSGYDLFIQLDFPPYTWPAEAEQAFVRYIEEGKGGWIGFHHATLLGEFDGYPLWQWFSDFMGGIRFKNYIAETASATFCIVDSSHPVCAGLPATFTFPDDDWFSFDRSPRPDVKVLATVDESSYQPASSITMGDHPVIWVNESKKARNVYFLFGHSGILFDLPEFTTLFTNAIQWAAQR